MARASLLSLRGADRWFVSVENISPLHLAILEELHESVPVVLKDVIRPDTQHALPL